MTDENTINTENKITFPSRRSMSRLVAFQTMYQIEFTNNIGDEISISEALDNIIENYIRIAFKGKKAEKVLDIEFTKDLINNTNTAEGLLKSDIEQFLKEDYSWEQISTDLRILLNLATYELKFNKEAPAKVIINEYTDVAASLLGKKQVNFINAIINNLAKKLRVEEF